MTGGVSAARTAPAGLPHSSSPQATAAASPWLRRTKLKIEVTALQAMPATPLNRQPACKSYRQAQLAMQSRCTRARKIKPFARIFYGD
ncbi:MAG: hypothetical protein DWI68_02350 [Chloroflexi bacterium]|nr:MAG: hypothetical protein DWI68_02350 [Chloroflexota bacterium]